MRTKYGALRAISIFYKLLAFVIFVLSLALAVVSIILLPPSSFWPGSTVTALTWAVMGSVSAVSMYATGAVFTLLIDMEENTRASRIVLTRTARWLATDPARSPAGVRRQPPPALDADESLLPLGEF